MNVSTRPQHIGPDETWIYSVLDYGYLGVDPAERLVAIFPVVGPIPVLGRCTGLLSVEYRDQVLIRVDDDVTTRRCCILALSDFNARRSFEALTRALSAALCGKHEVLARDFGLELANWERLFQLRRRLTPSEERGLWGELHLILCSDSPDQMIAHWRGPNAEDFDFLVDDLALEVKTSSRKGRHTVSHRQVVQASELNRVFLVSIWAAQDPTNGQALPEMIDSLTSRLECPDTFERKLLETGYSHADRSAYTERIKALCEPELFDMYIVPRIREMDAGVMNAIYDVQVEWDSREPLDHKTELLLKFSEGNTLNK